MFKAPIFILSFVLVALKVNIKLPSEVQNQTLTEKFQRIDYMGSLTLVCTVGCLLLGFSLKTTEELPWSHPLIYTLFITSAITAILFVLVEKHWSRYPVMPLRLVTKRTPLAVSLSNLFGSMAAFSVVLFLSESVTSTDQRLSRKLYNVPLVRQLI